MLRAIREHAQGWIAWVIVGLIILTFALFGIEQYAKGDKTVVVATVNGEDITASQFLTLYNRQKNRLQQQFGDMYDQVVKDEQLRDEVMQALVESEAIRQWADKHNLRVSDQQLAMTIHSASVFQKDGKFDQTVYEDILARNGLSVARFEYEQRQFLIENQMRQLTQSSAMAMPAQVDSLVALQTQQRSFNYLRVDQRPFLDKATVTDAEVDGYYADHIADYVAPEQVSLNYIELSQDELAKNLSVSADDLLAYYEANKNSFVIPEKRQASHILIRTTPGSEASEKEALAKIQEVQKELTAGADFAELAKKYSQDPGSAKLGGDLGLFQQGMMVPEFDEAVFTMQEGQTSESIKTDFGYHLIKLIKIEPKVIQAFDKVKDQVDSAYRAQEAEKQYFDLLEKMSTAAYEQSDSLIPAADAVGVTVKTTPLFQKQGGDSPITTNAKVLEAAFSEDVLKNKLNSAAIETSPKSSVVVRVADYVAERQKPLAEVREAVVTELKRLSAVKASAELAASLLEKVKQGAEIKSLEAPGIEWSVVGWVGHDNRSVLPQITQTVFKMPKPAENAATYQVMQLSTGDSLVLELSGVKQAEQALPAEQLAQLKDTLVEIMSTAEVDARIKTLVSEAMVEKKSVYKTLK